MTEPNAIPRFVQRLLHIGCGCGDLGKAVKQRGTEVIGVELDPEAASEAQKHLDKVFTDDLVSFGTVHFDCIVLDAPQYESKGLGSWLSEDGLLLVGGPEKLSDDEGLELYDEKADGTAVFVRQGYDPVAHAQRLLAAGQPGWSLEILEAIPERCMEDPRRRYLVIAEKQLCYLVWEQDVRPEDKLIRFFRAQQQFYLAVYMYPFFHQAYTCQAEFWRRIGNPNMGRRLLKTIQRVDTNEEIELALSTDEAGETADSGTEPPPEWDETFKPRILIIGHPESDYGMDTLYDGLCQTLGSDHVVEYPWKPFLHGRDLEQAKGYPCTFNHDGAPKSFPILVDELTNGAYDIVLYADIVRKGRREDEMALLKAARNLPLFLVDTWDDCSDDRHGLLEYLECDKASIISYFKREMLACWDYGERVHPLPFSYPDSRVPDVEYGDRTEPLFWAGHRNFGMRRLYLEQLEKRFSFTWNKHFSQEDYVNALQNSCIGLDFFGFGYDTVRYWELPAHGCMLLAERRPIRIPHDYVDGESAVFFDNLPDLEEKLDYYLRNLDEAQTIAKAGHEHFKRFHTSSKRARQLLGRLAGLLGQ